MVEVSAKQKTNLPKLLEMILLVADLRELKANSAGAWQAAQFSNRAWDRGRGPVGTMLVQNGTLHGGRRLYLRRGLRQGSRDV